MPMAGSPATRRSRTGLTIEVKTPPSRAKRVSCEVRDAIEARGRVAEERALLLCAAACGQALECVPEQSVARQALVDGEVALEHAPRGAEQFDAGLHVGPPCLRHLRGRRRSLCLVKAEAGDRAREPPELDGDVAAIGKLGEPTAPLRE